MLTQKQDALKDVRKASSETSCMTHMFVLQLANEVMVIDRKITGIISPFIYNQFVL